MGSRCHVLIAAAALLGCAPASSADESFAFNSLAGRAAMVISQRDGPPKEYAVRIYDTTVISEACDERLYRVCVYNDHIDFAVPLDPPQTDVIWKVHDAKFWVEKRIDRMELLNAVHNDLYLIRVERDLGLGVRRLLALYSYSEGLLSFWDLPGDDAYVASKLPSLGHSAGEIRSD
jgi:hypothetical protein